MSLGTASRLKLTGSLGSQRVHETTAEETMTTTPGNGDSELPGKPPIVDLATWQAARPVRRPSRPVGVRTGHRGSKIVFHVRSLDVGGAPPGGKLPMSAPTLLPMLATCKWISSRRSVFFFTREVRAVFSEMSVLMSSVLLAV
jgi:hypothetical protein